MSTKKPSPLAPVVAVLNMKGGVGKTAISAHVMRILYRILNKRVLLVDFDPQFNLTQTVIPRATYEKYKQENRTVLSVMEPAPQSSLFTVTTSLPPPPPLDDVSVQLKYVMGGTPHLNLVPGDFGLVKYSLIDDAKTLAPVKSRFQAFIANARTATDLVCIDCNPSSSFMTVCALEVATHLLIPVRPDRFSMLGLEILDDFVTYLPTLKHPPKQLIVLNGIPRSNYNPEVENILRSHPKFGDRTLSTPLYHTSLIAASPSYTGFATDKPVSNRQRVTKNVEALAREIGKELGM
ncbi:MAG TPA: ParA family protein [Pyrinomonadaceae bacterium]|nr:ParA family protein [Pyrinomonadaceae bacterium]